MRHSNIKHQAKEIFKLKNQYLKKVTIDQMHNSIATHSNTEPAGSGYTALRKTGFREKTTEYTEENTKKMSGIAGKTGR